MRFKAAIANIQTFIRLIASLNSLGKDVWLQLTNEQLRFTVTPDQGSQVWAVVAIDTIFDSFLLQSAADNVINLRVPLGHLHRALRSALAASSASIRLTKRDNIPLLSLTITTSSLGSTLGPTALPSEFADPHDSFGALRTSDEGDTSITTAPPSLHRDRETTITQDIPVIVLSPNEVAGLHEPVCPQPDVHILLPPLGQIKTISERFTKLASTTRSSGTNANTNRNAAAAAHSVVRLTLSATALGRFRIALSSPHLNISSVWTGLTNPELDPAQVGGEEGVATHASTLFRQKALRGEEDWAEVNVDGRDWVRVLSVGRMEKSRVVCCLCNGQGAVLYVYPPEYPSGGRDEEETGGTVLTYYIASYSS